jgi:hypothetical protein
LIASELLQLLASCIPARHNVLVEGEPGVGKSALLLEATRLAGANLIMSNPAVEEPIDTRGFPAVINERATFLPFGQLAQAIAADRPTVWALEDFGQATPAVQAGYMQLLWARGVDIHRLSEHVTFVACTNGRKHKANVSGILEPVKSRFVTIVELKADIHAFAAWYATTNLPPIPLAFVRTRPDLLSAFVPSNDLVNSPSPRTWENLAKLVALNLPAGIKAEAYAGAVGAGAATEYLAFEAIYAELPSVQAILANGNAGDIPSGRADRMVLLTSALAYYTTPANFPQVGRFIERLLTAGEGEYAALLITDAERRHPELTATPTYAKLMTGELGRIRSGRAA